MKSTALLILLLISIFQLKKASEITVSNDNIINEESESSGKKIKVDYWGTVGNEATLLRKIKIIEFKEVFERIPIEVFYFGMKQKFYEALEEAEGKISTRAQLARLLVNYFEKSGKLRYDEDRMALFTLIQNFWRGDQRQNLDEIAPELRKLIELSSLSGGFAIKIMLKSMKCRDIEDYMNKYTGGVIRLPDSPDNFIIDGLSTQRRWQNGNRWFIKCQ